MCVLLVQPVDDPSIAHQSDDFNDTFSASSHAQSPLIQSKPSQFSQSGVSLQHGLDTMEEAADKERFFAQLEEGRSSPVDYGELNRNEDLNVTTGTLKELEEQLRKKGDVIQKGRQIDKETDRQTNGKTCKQATKYTHVDRQEIDMHIDRQTDRQTN